METLEKRAEILVKLGELNYWRRQYARSIRFFEQAIELDPEQTSAHRGMGRVHKALDTEIRMEYEFSRLPKDRDWQRGEIEVSAWPHHLTQYGVRLGKFRRYGRTEDATAFWGAFELPLDFRVRADVGFARRALFLANQRYRGEVTKKFPPQGVEIKTAYERHNFGDTYVNIYRPLGFFISTWKPVELSGEYILVDDLQRRKTGAAWFQFAYFVTEDHSVHAGAFTGVDVQTITATEVQTDRLLGFFVGGVARMGRHMGAKADIRMQYRRGESATSLWQAEGSRLDLGLVLFVHF